MQKVWDVVMVGLVACVAMLLLGCISGGATDAATEEERIRQDILGRAVMVNDVTAMRGDPEMARTIAGSGAAVVLMHMLGEPRTMCK